MGLLTIKKTTKNRYRESKKEVVALQNELSIIQKRIDIIEDKYLDGELTKEQYNRMLERYTKEASTIQQQVEMRENPNRGIKIKLISSMFPEKIEFDGKTYRTNSYNKVLDLIYQQTNELRGVEKKNGESFSTFSASVPRAAFEIIKVGKMWVKRKMRKNAIITLYFNMLQSY